MQNLHAYWRMDYVEIPQAEKSKDDDPFLKIPSEDESTSLLIFRSELCYAALNKFPYNAGHSMVIPYRQVTDLQGLTAEEYTDMCQSILKMQQILANALRPHGFNIGYNLGSAAGAGIANHIHCHLVPRWHGDTNFMPVIGDTKVLPQALEKMVARLRSFA
ncbi:MAG: HIT domain-containing protein [Puniceicoccales bacterium]|jgi:ATP adenylyltransferase|nr:HIT domain-containing protein [Puniceicoccales bacterium]